VPATSASDPSSAPAGPLTRAPEDVERPRGRRTGRTETPRVDATSPTRQARFGS